MPSSATLPPRLDRSQIEAAMLTAEEQQDFLRQARAAIAAAIKGELRVSGQTRDGLKTVPCNAGAFVTIKVHGQLRGCIGYPEADLPLVEVVERCAVSAARADPRFPAVRQDECETLAIEISVLGPIAAVAEISEIEIGRHGLIAQLGHRRGLLLPQVAVEWRWNLEEFVCQTCLKAGLPRDAWRQGARLFKFEAEVFGDSFQ
jgi:AmmeMemoRadiSam system protein A